MFEASSNVLKSMIKITFLENKLSKKLLTKKTLYMFLYIYNKQLVMKKIIFFICILQAQLIAAQGDVFNVTDWYLYQVQINDTNIPIPFNDEIPYVQATFIEGSPSTFSTGACNACNGDVIVGFDTMEFSVGCTLSDCINPDNDTFNALYSEFFQQAGIYTYFVFIIDGPPGPDEFILSITAPNGDNLEYSDLQPLSVAENTLLQSTVYPNPASDVFFITFQNEDTVAVSLFDVTGKKVYQEQNYVSKSPILIPSFKKGMYFIKLETKAGTKAIKKLVVN